MSPTIVEDVTMFDAKNLPLNDDVNLVAQAPVV
ncbi:hypothetical protein SAMN06295998_11083 [Primorskyibacter flagellatus]|uniref:Uncharacterized protein n=1 Tax=Primorskyibacter flagellatus TaxID=1387277 RepID=A0A1W2D2Y0_9RHOB|nr:hypothetical protein SAMN06295998_11083 [Primorskyibacter flagellatus]